MAIDIEQLTESDIGRKVVYDFGSGPNEFGILTSWEFLGRPPRPRLFVRFSGPRGECCVPQSCRFLERGGKDWDDYMRDVDLRRRLAEVSDGK